MHRRIPDELFLSRRRIAAVLVPAFLASNLLALGKKPLGEKDPND